MLGDGLEGGGRGEGGRGAGLHGGVGLGDVAGERADEGDGVLGGSDGVGGRGVDDEAAELRAGNRVSEIPARQLEARTPGAHLGRGLEVDVIDTHPSAPHDTEAALRGLEDLAGDLRQPERQRLARARGRAGAAERTLVPLRTIRASTSEIFAQSSSGERS